MSRILNSVELPGKTSKQFEGYLYGDVDVSFFLSETPPGHGPSLHTHPYAEVFVVQEGNLTFVVGDETVEATGGHIVIAPANVPHKFTNTGASVARHVDIHTRSQMITTWLETS
jgi:mannose-6-phosphate isomerase-like protein (cupin superfamily)